MRRHPVALVAVFVAYLMAPGSIELTESVAHLVVHGDTAHGDAEGHDKQDGTDEHGCSGGYHLCVCHHATGFVVPLGVAMNRLPALAAGAPLSLAGLAPGAELGRIFRPPIA